MAQAVDPLRYPYVVRSVTLDPDGGVALEYCERAKDIRVNGLVLNRVMYVPGGSDYDDEIEEIYEAIQALVRDIERDMTLVEPFREPERESE